jgi:hypothetical protein
MHPAQAPVIASLAQTARLNPKKATKPLGVDVGNYKNRSVVVVCK